MRKIKEWLLNKFLPAWAKDSVFRENQALRNRVARLEAEIARLNVYIDGIEAGFRAQRRIVIHNEVKK